MPAQYQPTPVSDAQRKCPHRIRNRANDECATCGSRKRNGRWEYLTEPWLDYYLNGAPRPPE